MDTTPALASLAVAGASLLLLSRRGAMNLLFGVAAFFAFFAYGPVISVLRGDAVFIGIDLLQVDRALTGFALAMAAMAVAGLLVPQRREFDDTLVRRGERIYPMLPFAYVILIGYGVAIMATHGGSFASGKRAAIVAAGPLHYDFLLVEAAAVSMFFLTRHTTLLRQLWAINLVVYLVYSVATSERDFLFVLFSVIVHREILGNKRRSLKLTALAGGSAVLGSYLAVSRAGGAFTSASVLNQGSLLFVDSYVTRYVPGVFPYELGQTYLDSLTGLIPGVNHESLAQWLVQMYAPGSQSGYGFSLSAEAYMNFGFVGIPAVFFALSVAHRKIVNRADKSDWSAFFSVYFVAMWMYALRGESAQLFSALLFGAVMFGIIRVTAVRSAARLVRQSPQHVGRGRQSGHRGR